MSEVLAVIRATGKLKSFRTATSVAVSRTPGVSGKPRRSRATFKASLANCPEPDVLAKHVRTFTHMVTDLQGDQLPERIESASAATGLPSLSRLAQQLERHLDAVVADSPSPWNSGVTEGHSNQIKMLKRHLFVRAGFKLLRKRVLLAK
ncbi:transposase [Streptomyces sp. 3330]|uniref:hypothetical protein n=1 Tax=Streptomyces sp. 3330 TaxID=2817755 RepID=UPI00286368B6|nr:hypothetical protein [Streptomyces sp. 3330]MDR6981120.1 transposase [Streptomyces sp. 3330]